MQTEHRRTRRLTIFAVPATIVALAASPAGVAAAQDSTIDDACRERAQQATPFADVDADSAHAEAIACLWTYWIVQGSFASGDGPAYQPSVVVNRQQMASFVAQTLDVVLDRHHSLPDADPEDVEQQFNDGHHVSEAHAVNVARLHDAGIVAGYDDGSYRPGVEITRAQMATFLVRAIEDVTGEALPRTQSFDDVDDDSTHAANIEKLASIGVTAGQDGNNYGPGAATTRAQMASFVARTLDYLVTEGFLVPADYAAPSDGSRIWVSDVDAGVHDTHDRAAFRVEGTGEAGWNARYVDQAFAQGSGDEVEVAGDAILEITVTGATYPDEGSDVWTDTVNVDGAAIVELVSGSVFEGHQLIWVGTTGEHEFTLERTVDGDFYLDVAHP